MSEVSIDAAAASLNEIIDQLSADGQPVVVTRDGKAVAQITTPTEESAPGVDRQKRQRFLETLNELRQNVSPMTKGEIVNLVREGRPQR